MFDKKGVFCFLGLSFGVTWLLPEIQGRLSQSLTRPGLVPFPERSLEKCALRILWS